MLTNKQNVIRNLIFILCCTLAASFTLAQAKDGVQPWNTYVTKLTELEAKIKMKEGEIQKLILEKKSLEWNAPRLKEVTDLMVSQTKELNRYIDDYKKNRTILQYRFPEMSAPVTRSYVTKETLSVEDTEARLTIDAILNGTLQVVRDQYGAEVLPASQKPTSYERSPTWIPGSVEDPTPLILKK